MKRPAWPVPTIDMDGTEVWEGDTVTCHFTGKFCQIEDDYEILHVFKNGKIKIHDDWAGQVILAPKQFSLAWRAA